MKRFSLVFLSLAMFLAVAATGCLDSSTDKPVKVGATLMEGHSGWGSSECATCHPVSSMVKSEAGKSAHEAIMTDEKLDSDAYVTCTACHGSNGVIGAQVAGCTTCHMAFSQRAAIVNPRFSVSHPTTLIDADCSTCHNLTGHTKPVTVLNSAFSDNCNVCHNLTYLINERPFDVETHFGKDCVTCHSTDYTFVRELNNPKVILQHNLTSDASCTSCHSATSTTATIVNPRFVISHPSSLAASQCITCHNLTGHTEPVTVLTAEFSANCATCHNLEHKVNDKTFNAETHFGKNCIECHKTDYSFVRNAANPKDILQHKITMDTSCVTCHSATSTTAKIVNPRFIKTHPATLGDNDCQTCHDITGHTAPVTKLKVMEANNCAVCHTNYVAKINAHQEQEHIGITCVECHTDFKAAGFKRNATKPSDITGHTSIKSKDYSDSCNSGCHS